MKIFKRILAVVLAAASLLCFSSCLALDRAKEHQMFLGEKVRVRSEGNDNYADRDIIFKDKTYVRVAPYGFYETRYFRFDFTFRDEYRVTDTDVPVLLAEQYGTVAEYDADLDIIWYADSFYCTEENYEKYSRLLTEPDLSCVAIEDCSNPHADRAEFIILPETISKEILSLENINDAGLKDHIYMRGIAVMQLYITTPELDIFDIRDVIVFEYQNEYYAVSENKEKMAKLPDDVVDELKSHPDSWYTYRDYGYYGDPDEYYEDFDFEIDLP
ncbi:MAG: hypothetical protein IKN38_10150 [Clostridia bacterium]|nr:hypothetical protein [Clostridia bacterium]